MEGHRHVKKIPEGKEKKHWQRAGGIIPKPHRGLGIVAARFENKIKTHKTKIIIHGAWVLSHDGK